MTDPDKIKLIVTIVDLMKEDLEDIHSYSGGAWHSGRVSAFFELLEITCKIKNDN